jgi:hypothetical protein
MAVPISVAGDRVDAGVPAALFRVEPGLGHYCAPAGLWPYAVHPDGRRFLVPRITSAPTSPPLAVVLNWTAALPE